MGGEWREDSEAVIESFWDAHGVEIEVKQSLDFRRRHDAMGGHGDMG